jgi:hypothetical protein
MLDLLLVLGQVPGTDHQITFNQFLAICLAVAGLFVIRRKGVNFSDLKRIKIKKFHIRYLIRHRRLYLLTKKGTQLKLPV